MAVRLAHISFLFSFALASLNLFAAQGPQSFTLDGQLKDASTSNPITNPNVRIRLLIMNPTKTCVLYAEEQYVNTAASNGYFNIQVGSETGNPKRVAGTDPGNVMSAVFQNASVIVGNDVPGQTCGGSYTPAARDSRYLRIIVEPSGGSVETMSPDTIMDSVPMAVIAEDAQTLRGFGPADLLRVNTAGGVSLSQANLEAMFTGSAYTNLQAIMSGDFTSKTSTGGASIPSYTTAAPPSAPSAGSVWFDSDTGQIKYYNGSSTEALGVAGSGVTSVSVSSDLEVDGTASGTLTSTGTISLADSGVTAGTYQEVTVDAKGRITGGSNNVSTSGTVSAAGVSARLFDVYDSDNSNYIRLQTPATGVLSSNYVLTLPADDGDSGEVLSTDGSGNLTWSVPASSGLSTSLASASIYVGNASGAAAAVSVSGDATLSNAGALTIANDSISFAKMQNINTNRLLGRSTATAGDVEELSIGSGLSLSAGVLSASGLQAISNTASLASGKVWIGDGSGVAQENSVSSDLVVASGALSVSDNLSVSSVLMESGTPLVNVAVQANPLQLSGYSLVLPLDDGGANQVLQTDGSGNLSWVNQSNGADDMGDHIASQNIQLGSYWLSGDGGNEGVAIDAAGNVGVGIAAPKTKLHVAGTLRVGDSGEACDADRAGGFRYNGGNMQFCDGAGTWQTLGVAGGGITALTGDVVASGSGSVAATIASGAVSYAKIQNVTDNRILGRSAGSAGTVQEISIGTGLSLSSGTLSADNNGTVTSVSASAPLAVANGSTTPNISLSLNSDLEVASGDLAVSDNLGVSTLVVKGASANVTLQPNGALASSYSLSLPLNDGDSGQVLQTDGSGVLSWTTPAGVAADSLDFSDFKDAMTLDASTDISVTGTNMLSITNSGSSNSLLVRDENTDSTPFVIDGSGKVGIGSPSPTYKVDVRGSDEDLLLNVQNNSSTAARNPGIRIHNYNGGFGGGPIVTGVASRGSVALPGLVQSGDSLLILQGRGAYDASYNYGTGAQIQFQATESFASGQYGSKIIFQTAQNDGSSLNERMVIDNNGEVGIGISNPNGKLDVKGSILMSGATSGYTGFQSPANGPNLVYTLPLVAPTAGQVLSSNASGVMSWSSAGGGGDFKSDGSVSMTGAFKAADGDATAPGISFDADPNTGFFRAAADSIGITTGGSQKLLIDASGNVGIGTTSGGERLEVSGNVKAASFISTSDLRLKREIQSVAGISAIEKLNGVSWRWLHSNEQDMGVIAQEVEEVFPWAVVTDSETGLKSVKYSGLVAPLIEASKEIYGICKANEKRDNDQDRRIASLEEMNQKLVEQNRRLNSEVDSLRERMNKLEDLLLRGK